MTLKLAETSVVKSRPSVPYGANLFHGKVVLPVTQWTVWECWRQQSTDLNSKHWPQPVSYSHLFFI